jgi:hypothetical protein
MHRKVAHIQIVGISKIYRPAGEEQAREPVIPQLKFIEILAGNVIYTADIEIRALPYKGHALLHHLPDIGFVKFHTVDK